MENITEKKKAIFESTLKLVKEHGFHGCPMSMVAKNANVAAGTIYHYFESKDQLIYELYDHLVDQVITAATKDDDATQPFRDRFFVFWKNLFAFYIQNPDVPRYFEQFFSSPYYIHKFQNGERGRFHELICNFFKEGVDQGELRQVDPEILSVLVHGSIITTVKHQIKRQMFCTSSLEEAEFMQIAQIIWDGIVKQ